LSDKKKSDNLFSYIQIFLEKYMFESIF